MKKVVTLSIFFSLLLIGTSNAQAAPDITIKNMSGAGSFVAGQPIAFTYDVLNQDSGMNTSNSYSLVKLGGATIAGAGARVTVNGNYAYVSNSSVTGSNNSWEVYDISNPTNPVKTAGFYNHSYIYGRTVIVGNYAYLGTGGGDFRVFDLTNPAVPVLAGSLTTSHAMDSFVIRGQYVYAPEFNNGFQIFDISNPLSPTLKGEYNELPGTVRCTSADVSGNYAYVACDGVINIFDVSNPASITKAGAISISMNPKHAKVYGSYLYVIAGTEFLTYNIANPLSPVKMSSVADSSNGDQGDIGISGSYLYTHTGNVYSIVNPANPVKVYRNYTFSGGYVDADGRGNFINSKYVYTAGYDFGGNNQDFEIHEPHVFSRVCIDNANCLTTTTGTVGTYADAGSLPFAFKRTISATWSSATIGKHTAYFCSDIKNSAGFDGVAESNENNNCQSVTFTVSATAQVVIPQTNPDITVRNMNITSGEAGSPMLVTGQPIKFTYEVFNQGDDMDTTNSYNLVKLGSLSKTGFYGSADIGMYGNYIYIPTYNTGYFIVVDISDPNNPVKVREVSIPLGSFGGPNVPQTGAVKILDHYAYVGVAGIYDYNVCVYDISNPSDPIFIKGVKTTEPGISSVVIYGNYLFTGNTNGHKTGAETTFHGDIEIFDISNRENPVSVNKIEDIGAPSNIFIKDSYLYVAASGSFSDSRLSIYDISNPLSAVSLSNIPVSKISILFNRVFVVGSYLYLGKVGIDGTEDDFEIYDVSNPSNPFKVSGLKLPNSESQADGIAVNGKYAYVGGNSGAIPKLNVIDISNSADPKIVGRPTFWGGNFSNTFNQKYVFSGGLVSNYLIISEPHAFSRVCIDNPNCINPAVPVAPALNLGDADAGSLSQNFTRLISTTWATPTVGDHMAYFCSDVLTTDGTGSYDGVAELDEANNCQSVPFTVFSTAPILKICKTACDIGPLIGSSITPGTLNWSQGESDDYVACMNSKTDCSDPTGDVTNLATWTEVAGNDAISITTNGSKKTIAGVNPGSETFNVSYLGLTASSTANVTCTDNAFCDTTPEADNYCVGGTFTLPNACGVNQTCSGKKDCSIDIADWKEVAP